MSLNYQIGSVDFSMSEVLQFRRLLTGHLGRNEREVCTFLASAAMLGTIRPITLDSRSCSWDDPNGSTRMK